MTVTVESDRTLLADVSRIAAEVAALYVGVLEAVSV